MPIVRLTSVTYSIRAQKLLEHYGIKTYVRKISKNANLNGCGYGLEVRGNVQNAIQIIEAAGIRVMEVIGGDSR